MLVDSHCHLDFPDFATELDAVVARARAAGIGRIVTISTKVKNQPQLIAIAEKYTDVFCTVGTHPHHASSELDVDAQTLIGLAKHPKVVAIGEAGLDYHYDTGPRDDQLKSFHEHIAATREAGLPLVIHSRDCDADMAAVLKEEMALAPFKGVLHCFTAGAELARTAIDLGLYIGFTGILTFKSSPSLREIAKALPAERILVETDSPYLAPVPYRGKRCEPAYVAETAKVLAETRGVAPAEIAGQTTENFFRLFDKVPQTLVSAA